MRTSLSYIITPTTLQHGTAHASAPRTLQALSEPGEPPRFLSKPAYEALLKQIRALASAQGTTEIGLDSHWRSDVRWARNRVTMSGDWRDVEVGVTRRDLVTPNQSGAGTNQLDTGSLHGAVVWGETIGQRFFGIWPERAAEEDVPPPRTSPFVYPDTHIWSDVTFRQSYEERVTIANALMAGADDAGMLSAGYLAVEAGGVMLELKNKYVLYAPQTEAQLSMTVRDPDGSGSGWAGVSSYDWSRIDAATLAAIALDKCLKSRHPVRIEPGRYTVILEPQATYAVLEPLHWYDFPHAFLDLAKNLNNPEWPFALPERKRLKVSKYGDSVTLGYTRLGQRVFDRRLNMYFNPTDPELGRLPWWTGEGDPMPSVQWIREGILENLSYPPHVGTGGLGDLAKAIDPKGKPCPGSFRLDAGTNPPTSTEEMIATTKRGVLVTRFSDVTMVTVKNCLLTGTTRDGTWLIENGTITHAVQNLRFTESPLFVFNQVEQIGATVPVFAPGKPAAVPTVKARDFSFTALEDAV